MSYIPVLTAHPSDKLPYQIDWRDFLGANTISTMTWTIAEGPDADLVLTDPSHAEGIATVWAAGGTADRRYRLQCTVTVSDGSIKHRSIWLEVQIE